MESFSGSSESRWNSDQHGMNTLLLVSLGLEKDSVVSLPKYVDVSAFDTILIEEVSNITSLSYFIFLILESRNTLHVAFNGYDSIRSFLSQMIISSDVNLYCLASNRNECPDNFKVIQVELTRGVNHRV